METRKIINSQNTFKVKIIYCLRYVDVIVITYFKMGRQQNETVFNVLHLTISKEGNRNISLIKNPYRLIQILSVLQTDILIKRK